MLQSTFPKSNQVLPMPNAVPYSRFSSGKQASGSSLERQQSLIGAWLNKNPEYSIFHESYEDLGRSGASGEHLKHGFGRLLEAIEMGRIKEGDVILIESIDRAGRLPELQMLEIVQKITSKGVAIVTLDDNVTYDGNMAGTGQLWQLLGKVQQAYAYSESLSKRIKASYKARRRAAAEGKTVKRRTPVWLTSDGKLNERIAPYINAAFEDYAAGIGERRILNSLRGKEPEFESLNPSTIKRWFRNNTAIGYWGELPNVYPQVVTKELFFKVQKRMLENKPNASSPTKHLLSGLVVCGVCGANFTYKKHKNSAPTMGCSRRARLGASGCKNSKTIPAHVLDFIRTTTSYPALTIAISKNRLSESESTIVQLESDIADAKSRSSNIINMIAKLGSDPQLEEAYATLKDTTERLTNQVTYLKAQAEPSQISYDDANELELDLLDEHPMKLNSLLQQAGYKIYCTDRDIDIEPSVYSSDWGYPKYTYAGVTRTLPDEASSPALSYHYELIGLSEDGAPQSSWYLEVRRPTSNEDIADSLRTSEPCSKYTES